MKKPAFIIVGMIAFFLFIVLISKNHTSHNFEGVNTANTQSTQIDDEKVVNDIRKYLSQNTDIVKINFEYHPDWTYVKSAYNQEMSLILKDKVFTQSLSNQYKIVKDIFEGWLNIIKEAGGKPDGNILRVGKENNEYYSYIISEEEFKLISLNKKYNRNDLDKDPSVLDTLDHKSVVSGTYGGQKTKEKSGKYLDRYDYTYIYKEGQYVFIFSPNYLPRNDTVLIGAFFEAIEVIDGKHQLIDLNPKIKVGKNGIDIIYFIGIKYTYNFLIFKNDDGTVYGFSMWKE